MFVALILVAKNPILHYFTQDQFKKSISCIVFAGTLSPKVLLKSEQTFLSMFHITHKHFCLRIRLQSNRSEHTLYKPSFIWQLGDLPECVKINSADMLVSQSVCTAAPFLNVNTSYTHMQTHICNLHRLVDTHTHKEPL